MPPGGAGAVPSVLAVDCVELRALELESVDAALVVHVQHRPEKQWQCYHQHMEDELVLPVEYFDVGVERNVSSLRKTRYLVRLVQLVLVAGGLPQAHNHSW